MSGGDAAAAGRRSVVITGCSSGIGRATALRLARAGHRVFAGVRREADTAALRGEGVPGLEPLLLDVTDAAQVGAAAKTVETALGGAGLDGLVNNAGITTGGPLEHVDPGLVRRVLEVNTVGALAATQAFLPLLRRARGRVVLLSSIGGRVALPVVWPYNASKFALEALGDALRGELAPFDVEVALVEPGAIRTAIFDKGRALADEILAAMPDEGRRRYEPILGAVIEGFTRMEAGAGPPEKVGRAIERALLDRRPRTRALVGADARGQAVLAALLPDRARDALLARFLGLPRRGAWAEAPETRRHPGGRRGAVVVTGASSGIGRATALHLARAGHRVFAGVRREADAAALRSEGLPGLEPLLLDVTDAEQVAAAARHVEEATGAAGLAGLVNNAGIGVGGPLEFLPLEELRRVLEVNVHGVVSVTQAFLPGIRRAGGRVVIVGSSSGRLAVPFAGPYAASKFAVEALADGLRMELAPWDLHVALLEPGAVDTAIWEKTQGYADALEARLPEEARALYGEAIAGVRRRLRLNQAGAASPEGCARAVAHALTARRPRTRYPVGLDGRVQILLAGLLPDRLRDRLIARLLAG